MSKSILRFANLDAKSLDELKGQYFNGFGFEVSDYQGSSSYLTRTWKSLVHQEVVNSSLHFDKSDLKIYMDYLYKLDSNRVDSYSVHETKSLVDFVICDEGYEFNELIFLKEKAFLVSESDIDVKISRYAVKEGIFSDRQDFYIEGNYGGVYLSGENLVVVSQTFFEDEDVEVFQNSTDVNKELKNRIPESNISERDINLLFSESYTNFLGLICFDTEMPENAPTLNLFLCGEDVDYIYRSNNYSFINSYSNKTNYIYQIKFEDGEAKTEIKYRLSDELKIAYIYEDKDIITIFYTEYFSFEKNKLSGVDCIKLDVDSNIIEEKRFDFASDCGTEKLLFYQDKYIFRLANSFSAMYPSTYLEVIAYDRKEDAEANILRYLVPSAKHDGVSPSAIKMLGENIFCIICRSYGLGQFDSSIVFFKIDENGKTETIGAEVYKSHDILINHEFEEEGLMLAYLFNYDDSEEVLIKIRFDESTVSFSDISNKSEGEKIYKTAAADNGKIYFGTDKEIVKADFDDF